MVNKRAIILTDAENLINGDRAQSYGPPQASFSRIAKLWAAMGFTVKVEAHDMDVVYREPNATDVALALIQLKAARLTASPDHEDSWVDIAGYAGLGGEIALGGLLLDEEKTDPTVRHGVSLLYTPTRNKNVVNCSLCFEKVFRGEMENHADAHQVTVFEVAL